MKHWKKALIHPSATLKQVIETIDSNAMQIAVVVDFNGRLLGCITDGDVRRAILKGVSLEGRAEQVMKQDPITANESETKEAILERMRQYQIHQIPVVNKARRVIGLEVLDELLRPVTHDHWVVLMAGGLGSRLRPLTNDLPKPLIPVGKRPILETILKNFIDYGLRNFYISVNYKDEMIKNYFGDGSKWGAHIVYISESERLGTAGALRLLPNKPVKPFFVMNGDLLTKVNFQQLLNFHHENNAAVTMCVKEYDFQVPFGVVVLDRHQVRGIDEKPVQKFFVNAGIYVLEPEVLKHMSKQGRMDMPQLFGKIIKKRRDVVAFPVREYWLDIGQAEDLKRAHVDFKRIFQ